MSEAEQKASFGDREVSAGEKTRLVGGVSIPWRTATT